MERMVLGKQFVATLVCSVEIFECRDSRAYIVSAEGKLYPLLPSVSNKAHLV